MAELPYEKKLTYATKGFWGILSTMMRVLESRYGKEVYDVLCEGMAKSSEEEFAPRIPKILRSLKRKGEIDAEERDAIAAAKMVAFAEETWGLPGEFVELKPERAVRRFYECPWKEVATPEVCRLLDCNTIGQIRAVNPDLIYEHPKLIVNGDPHCEWIIRLKEK